MRVAPNETMATTTRGRPPQPRENKPELSVCKSVKTHLPRTLAMSSTMGAPRKQTSPELSGFLVPTTLHAVADRKPDIHVCLSMFTNAPKKEGHVSFHATFNATKIKCQMPTLLLPSFLPSSGCCTHSALSRKTQRVVLLRGGHSGCPLLPLTAVARLTVVAA